jgi:IS1 family transposase
VVIYKKKQKNVGKGKSNRPEDGDVWIYISKKRDTKLELAHATGKRIQDTANELIKKTKKRGKKPTKEKKATFISEGNDQYVKALTDNFDEETINYGQLVKEREGGRVVRKTRRIIFGDVEYGGIDTVYIERYNNTLRHNISRLVRKTLCFSKCKEMLDDHLDVHQCYNNLIRTNLALTIKMEKGVKNIERTPCMVEGITDHVWDWNEMLRFRICHEN